MTCQVSSISLGELVNALQAQKQRRLIRGEGSVEGALQAKLQNYKGGKNKKNEQPKDSRNGTQSNNIQVFSACSYRKKTNHPQKRWWWRLDTRCYKCDQVGHMEKICKSHQQGKVKVADNQREEE